MLIEARYNGPPDSANGGYAAGIFAGSLDAGDGTGTDVDGPVEVTLRRPPPLGVPLVAVPTGSAGSGGAGSGGAGAVAVIRDPDGAAIAEIRRVTPFAAVGSAVSWAVAVEAAAAYAGHTGHPFPGCYVCGPARADGLRIFPGRLPDGRVAAPFVAPAEVRPETVWAALDCPGGWTVLTASRPYLLGRITAVVSALPAPGEECVVTGVCERSEGRKAIVHSTLHRRTGEPLAHARASWIAPRT